MTLIRVSNGFCLNCNHYWGGYIDGDPCPRCRSLDTQEVTAFIDDGKEDDQS